MRHQFFYILAGALMGLTALSCSDNDYAELDKGRFELELILNQSFDVLDERNHGSEAVALSWTTGNNNGSGNRISYTLEIGLAGTDYVTASVPVDNATQVYSWTASVEQLNDLLRQWNCSAGEAVQLDARVTATVAGMEGVQTSETTFTVTPYEPVTKTLYLIGDATPNGWSADNATEMHRTDNGIFTWEGNLKAGSLKFITTLGQFVPSYNKGADGKMIIRNSFDEPDEQWHIDEAHAYRVTANLLTGELSLVQTTGEMPRWDQLFFVGSCTGWGFVEMTRDALDPYLFRYGRHFTTDDQGEFKFGTSQGWENMLKATQPNAPYTDTSMEFISGYDPDNKWFLNASECDRAYKICVDTRNGRERMLMSEFQPYPMIYLIGSACSAGWDLGNALEMTATDSPYVFTWTGRLTGGELKFTCDKKSDWGGAWFMCAAGSNVAPTGSQERMLFIDKSSDACKAQYLDTAIGDIDQKWQIAADGTYEITLNQLEETITIAKQ